MKQIIGFFKKEVVLTAAWFLAVLTALVIHPSFAYLDYIDFRSLGILWSLMVIMQVLKRNAVFEFIGHRLLSHTHKVWQLAATLVFLCFFSSMLITNDVALLTFVPFSIMMLKQCDRKELLIPVIVLQTIAANLGSMMTPVGNPQNLYLYGISGLGFSEFCMLVAPYTAVTGILLAVCIFFLKGKSDSIIPAGGCGPIISQKFVIIIYALLFVLSLMVVARVVPYYFLVIAVFVFSAVLQRKALMSVDYNLLLTFVGFFIFTGNVGCIPAFSQILEKVVSGHELAAGILTSQVISNVPAALLLSNFSQNLRSLILGVNFGGLGTIIASMASLISYKLYAADTDAQTGTYMIHFTIMQIVFLIGLLAAYLALSL